MLFRVIRQVLETRKLSFQLSWNTGSCVNIFFNFFFASLEIDWLFALSLWETFVFFQLIPCQSTYCHDLPLEQFNTTSLSKHMLLAQFLYTRESQRKGNFIKNLLIAGKRASILQCKVSVTLVKSNYLHQRALNLSILVEKMKKSAGLVLIIM